MIVPINLDYYRTASSAGASLQGIIRKDMPKATIEGAYHYLQKLFVGVFQTTPVPESGIWRLIRVISSWGDQAVRITGERRTVWLPAAVNPSKS